jgi:hypothetical protein
VRRSTRAAAALATAVLTVTSLSGCGQESKDSDKPSGDSEEGFSAAADLSTCQADATEAAKPYPDGFPADWPFPSQTVVFNAEDRGDAGIIVTGVSAAPFATVLAFMNKDVVAKGFKIESGETEERDAEAEWEGNGFRGRWAIRKSAKCPGETVIQVLSAGD